MKRVFLLPIYIYVCASMCLMTISGCKDSEEIDNPILPTPGSPGKTLARTLIVYMVGENSLAGIVSADSLEIAQGLSTIGIDHRVVVYIDDRKSSRLCVGTRGEPLQVVKTYDENVCSTDSTAMDKVLREIVSTYPAEHYSLVLWSHGSGWIPAAQTSSQKSRRRSYGIDNGSRTNSNTGVGMNIPVLAQLLSKFPRFDFILFDACFMQCVEVAYELRHVTDYVISSPAEIPGTGAPYDKILQSMCQIPCDIEALVKDYVDYYKNGEGRATYGGAELSAIRTSELETLAKVSTPYLQLLLKDQSTPDCSNVQCYNATNTTQFPEFYDIKNLMYNHLSTDEYVEWLAAFEAAVPWASLTQTWFSSYPSPYGSRLYISDLEHTGGVSVFVPHETYLSSGWMPLYREYEWYVDAGVSTTGW